MMDKFDWSVIKKEKSQEIILLDLMLEQTIETLI